MSAAADTLAPQETGVGMGLYNLIMFLGGALGPALFSVFLEYDSTRWNVVNQSGFASYSNAMLILSALCFGTLLLLSLNQRRLNSVTSGEQISG